MGVEVEKETSAPPPKKNPGSAPGFKKALVTLTRLYRCEGQKKSSFASIIIIGSEGQNCFGSTYINISTRLPATVYIKCHVVFICNLQIIVAARSVIS